MSHAQFLLFMRASAIRRAEFARKAILERKGWIATDGNDEFLRDSLRYWRGVFARAMADVKRNNRALREEVARG